MNPVPLIEDLWLAKKARWRVWRWPGT